MRIILLCFLILTLTACQGLISPATPTVTATITPTPTETITPTPTEIPYTFGFHEGMTIADCNKITLDADGKIPADYLAQERAWAAANLKPFAELPTAGASTRIKNFTSYNFPLPVYQVNLATHDIMVDCAKLEDASLIVSTIVSPYDMPDRANVTAENVPILHFAYPQASFDWVNQNRGLFYQLDGADPNKLVGPTEALAFLASPDQLEYPNALDIWVVAPTTEHNDVTLLDPSLKSLRTIIEYNRNYVSPVGNPNVVGDMVQFTSQGPSVGWPEIDKIPFGEPLSNIVIPVLAFTFEFPFR